MRLPPAVPGKSPELRSGSGPGLVSSSPPSTPQTQPTGFLTSRLGTLYHATPAHIKETLVDLINDLQMAGKQCLHEVHWPALQGFRQHCVVGVGTGLHCHIPGLAYNAVSEDRCSPPAVQCMATPRAQPGFSELSGPQYLFSALLTFHLTLVRRPWDRVAPVRVKWLIPTLSQSSRSRSTRILISSGMAKEGWVSLSWMATCGKERQVRMGCECSLPLQSPQKAR